MNYNFSISPSAQINPESVSLTATAEVRQSVSENAPPRIAIILTNIADSSHQLRSGFTPPFSMYELSAEADENQLVCVPPNFPGCPKGDCLPETPQNDCWTALKRPEILDSGAIVTLSPGENLEREYVILNHPSNEICFPTGRYMETDTIQAERKQAPNEISLAVTVAIQNNE